MTRRMMMAASGGLLVLAAVALSSVYTVGQDRQALVLRFGEPVAVVNSGHADDAGPKTKLAFVDRVISFDKRDQTLESGEQEILTADQNRLLIDAFMQFRILDPLKFFRTLGEERTAADGLRRTLGSSLREVLGSASARDIVQGRRDELMARVREQAARQAAAGGLGIAVSSVMIRRIDLPRPALEAVIRQMQSARQAQAAQIRNDGEQRKHELMAAADKEVAIIRGDAAGQAEQIRGEGEARRDAILAKAYGADPEFARFYRTMQAYQSALGSGDTTMLLSPNSEFLRDFTKSPGADR